MIQRIQTIYLFLAAASGFSALALPYATSEQASAAASILSDHAYNAMDNISLTVLFAVAGALALGGIFLFANRPIQIKLAWLAIIANLVGGAMVGLVYFQDPASSDGTIKASFGFGAMLPILFLVFGLLAIKGIKKDESIVKSADRLR